MAMLSKAFPLTAGCLSTLPGIRSQAGECEKVASDLGLGCAFRRLFRFPSPLTTG